LTPSASVAVVTDSAAGLPDSFLEQYNISVVPYYVHLGETSYISGVTIDPPTFFERLRAAPEMEVHTGVPTIAKFLDVYRDLADWAEGIVGIHVAGKMSGTCSAAEVAAAQSPVPVVVLDTETSAMGEGYAVLSAARAAQEGGTLEQVVATAKATISNTGLYALLESVTYALKGGRLSATAAKVGSRLRIQPLIRVKNNSLNLIGQVRRRSRGVTALMDKVVDEVRDDPVHIAVHYAEDESEGQSVLASLRARLNCVESYLMRVPVELGVHAGPGALGIGYHVEREESAGLVQQIEERLGRITTQAKDAVRSRLHQ